MNRPAEAFQFAWSPDTPDDLIVGESRAGAAEVSSIQIASYRIHGDRDLTVEGPFKPREEIPCYACSGGQPDGLLEHCSTTIICYTSHMRKGRSSVPSRPLYLGLANHGFKEVSYSAVTPLVVTSLSISRTPTTQAAACNYGSPAKSKMTIHTIEAFIRNNPDEIANAKHPVYWSPAGQSSLAGFEDVRDFAQGLSPDLFRCRWICNRMKRLAVAMQENLGKERLASNECPGRTLLYKSAERSDIEKKRALFHLVRVHLTGAAFLESFAIYSAGKALL
ncbi:hypothetical protein BJ322DRAFT_1018815 [Thelephora terrestris]|uniref:Uncharacterized protein n=1 Tax=Thelephora terrestris TaxID=56493 RepID=A0A9P6HJ31_9AGAM|nr:hypothetical protein BJ322DRAFT_1018815 [Thelephora terrestris]